MSILLSNSNSPPACNATHPSTSKQVQALCGPLPHVVQPYHTIPSPKTRPCLVARRPYPHLPFALLLHLHPNGLPNLRSLQFRIIYVLIGFLDFCASSATSVLLFSRAVSYVGVPRFILKFDSYLIMVLEYKYGHQL